MERASLLKENQNRVNFFHSISYFFLVKIEFIFFIAFAIWKPYFSLKYTKLFLTRKNCSKSLENLSIQVLGNDDCNGGGYKFV